MKKILPLALALSACQSAPAGLPDETFLAISKTATTSDALLATQTDRTANDSFYVAIKKSELTSRWFLSAYLKQLFPYAVAGGAARSLGTQVVTFRLQNGKLFLFRADDTIKTSDTFDPQVIVDAYPVITDHKAFQEAGGYADYVLFDIASGQSTLGFAGDWLGRGGQRFASELQFMQRYRRIDDGFTMEMVFSGVTDVADPGSAAKGEQNALRTSGTLGLALRRYKEGEGFQAARQTELPYYFTSNLQLIPNTGETTAPYAKWNIKRGMKPIQWVISDQFLAYDLVDAYKDYDIPGLVKAAVESWNDVFGFRVIEARFASANDSFADDDTNYLIHDGDPSFGAAFANWRVNPNTGEIRGASVYMNGGWIQSAVETLEADAPPVPEPAPAVTPVPVQSGGTLTWGGLHESRLCEIATPDVMRALGTDFEASTGTRGPLDKKEKVWRFLRWLITHEVGHTLGLRHNFKGSVTAPASSVMDYLLDEDKFERFVPGDYDTDALKFLYHLSDAQPAQPFCTDENTLTDPNCLRYDQGRDPLVDWAAPAYRKVLADFLAGVVPEGSRVPMAPNASLNRLLNFARGETDTNRRDLALEAAFTGLMVGFAPSSADAARAGRIDVATRNLLSRLYLDTPAQRGGVFVQTPKLTSATLLQVAANLANLDGIRSYPTRRAMVDILKQDQTAFAAAILEDGKHIATSEAAAAVTEASRAEATDLARRIEEATSPYFK